MHGNKVKKEAGPCSWLKVKFVGHRRRHPKRSTAASPQRKEQIRLAALIDGVQHSICSDNLELQHVVSGQSERRADRTVAAG